MDKKLLFVVMALLALALAAFAADGITGKWAFEQAGRQGGPGQQVTLDLKADGANLTGTITGGGGMGRGGGAPGGAPAATPISNGKVDGSTVTFEVTRESPMGGSTTTKYEGTVSGAEMKLKITRPGRGGGEPQVNEVVAKKQ